MSHMKESCHAHTHTHTQTASVTITPNKVEWERLCKAFKIVSWCERWGAGVETQKNVRGEIGGWGRVPFNETYAPSLRTIYDGA